MARTLDPVRHKERRDAILDAAAHQIAARGYDTMTIADVIAEASISKGALYYYFSGKDELLQALIERRIERWTDQVDAAINEVNDPVERLRGLVRALSTAKSEDSPLLVGALPQLQADANAVLYVRLRRAAADRFLPRVTAVVEDGVRAGVFRAASAPGTAKVVLSLLHEMSVTASRGLLAIADGRAAPEELRAEVHAYNVAIPAVLGIPVDAGGFYDVDGLEDWIRAVLEGAAPAGHHRTSDRLQ